MYYQIPNPNIKSVFNSIENIICDIYYGSHLKKLKSSSDFKIYYIGNPYSIDMITDEEQYNLSNLDTWIMMYNLGVNLNVDNEIGLQWASEKGHYDIVRFLINHGANIHVENEYPIQLASQYGYYDIVQLLILRGANIHTDDEYALHHALKNNHLDIAQLLLEYGAEIIDYDY